MFDEAMSSVRLKCSVPSFSLATTPSETRESETRLAPTATLAAFALIRVTETREISRAAKPQH